MELPREYMIFKSRVLNFTLSSPDFESKKSIKLHARPVYGVLCVFFQSKTQVFMKELLMGWKFFQEEIIVFTIYVKKRPVVFYVL